MKWPSGLLVIVVIPVQWQFLLAVTSIMIIITILLINMVHGQNASFTLVMDA